MIKRIILYTALFTILFSCTSLLPLRPHHTKTDEVFLPYLKRLPVQHKTPIGFVKPSGWGLRLYEKLSGSYIVGFCGSSLIPVKRNIGINPDAWLHYSYYQRLALLLHEIGHCDFNLQHDKRLYSNGCPQSVMYPSVPSYRCLKKYWGSYVKGFRRKVE